MDVEIVARKAFEIVAWGAFEIVVAFYTLAVDFARGEVDFALALFTKTS